MKKEKPMKWREEEINTNEKHQWKYQLLSNESNLIYSMCNENGVIVINSNEVMTNDEAYSDIQYY